MANSTQTLAAAVAIAAIAASTDAFITASAETVAAPVAQKTPSKKSQALAIFAAKLVERKQGLYATNKEFRAAVLRAIETDLGVSTASAATMYNSAKVEAEAADATVGLGRDPKTVKVKAEGAGKRGRPAKAKVAAVVVTDAVAEPVADEGTGYAAPAEAVAA